MGTSYVFGDNDLNQELPSLVAHPQASAEFVTYFQISEFAATIEIAQNMSRLLLLVMLFFLTWRTRAFTGPALSPLSSLERRTARLDAFRFQRGVGSLVELGCVGEKGEFYFHPSKKASLTLPKGLDKNQIEKRSLSVPIFPYSSILVPTGAEWLNVFEMKHRQLLNDLGPDALFGFVYFSTSQQKFGLVGTLARIKSRKLLEDGRVFVTVEGVDRFYLNEFYSEKPYLKARVKVLSDYSLIEESELDNIETQVFDELRTNLKLMEHIFPSKNYHISKQILQNRPSTFTTRIGDRAVKLQDQDQEMERRSKFSYAVLETLQVSSSMKLKLLQEHVIENRLSKFLEILRAGKDFLKEELVSKKGYTEDMCNQIVLQSKHQTDLDAELLSDSSAWSSGINFKGNRWNQNVVYMD
jgi:hypothetical protein